VVVKTAILIILAAVAFFVWFVVKRPTPPPQTEQILPVRTVRATVGDLDRTMTLDSVVGSDSVVTVFPKVSGNLISLDADVGTDLKPGEVIGKIDPALYRIALNQAKAVYDGAGSVYERQKRLYSSGATSQRNFDRAQAQYENAKSQYELAKLRLTYTTITSPVVGAVVERHVSNGALVSPSVPIVTISNTRALVVRTGVPGSYARTFETRRETMAITASIPAMGDRVYHLRIRSISPFIDVRSKTFLVECEIDGDTSGILPGMFAQVTFVLDRRRGVAYLPYAALVGSDTLWYIDAKGRARDITFTPAYHNDTFFELPDRYKDYTFILAGQHFLSAGTPVRSTNSGRAAK
jgi:membrane fusion protein (multidrug efflux system)